MFISTAGWALPIQILAYYIFKINMLEMMCFGFPVMCTLVFSVFGRVGMREKQWQSGFLYWVFEVRKLSKQDQYNVCWFKITK
jgi:hypothetical protein